MATWERQDMGDRTTREGNDMGGIYGKGTKKMIQKQRGHTKRGDMDGKETYTKKKPLIIQKKNYTNKSLCGKIKRGLHRKGTI